MKALSVLLVFALFAACAPPNTPEQTPVSIGFYFDSHSSENGDITFHVIIEENFGMASGEWTLVFDPTVFDFSVSSFPGDGEGSVNTYNRGSILRDYSMGRLTHYFSLYDPFAVGLLSSFALRPLDRVTTEQIAAVSVIFTGISYPAGETFSLPARDHATPE